MNYNFDLDLKDGQIGEEQLKKILANPKIEVKTDFLSKSTGNIAVEFQCNGRLSGISTTEAQWWAFILHNEKRIVLIPTEELKKLCLHQKVVNGGDNNASKMYIIPKQYLI